MKAYDASFMFDEDEEEIECVLIHGLGTIADDKVYRYDWKEEGKFRRKVTSLEKKGDVIELFFGDDTINCCLLSDVNLDGSVKCPHVPADW